MSMVVKPARTREVLNAAVLDAPALGGAGHGVEDERYQTLRQRDRRADGRFVYAVRTTGVYCRPSCAARLPRRENVIFYPSCAAAEAAGYRSCKRCRPAEASQDQRHALAVRRACELLEAAEPLPSLEVLAAGVGISAHHFHRLFKRATGVTPRAYGDAARAQRVRAELEGGGSITRAIAIYKAGFNASSRFYAGAADRLGMTPSNYRRGGVGTTIRFAVGPCSLGEILVAATDKGVCVIFLGDDPDVLLQELQDRFRKAQLIGGDKSFETLVAQVVGLVESPARAVELPLDIQGTAFQQRVWEALRAIPLGQTTSYADIARAIGSPKAVRAVAGACASNKLAVAIPCHRVVRSDGDLSGYRWGVERKRTLLAREQRVG